MLKGTVRVAENPTKVSAKRPLANSEIDNKNRADITVGPLVKN
jgi:hypothetical protein